MAPQDHSPSTPPDNQQHPKPKHEKEHRHKYPANKSPQAPPEQRAERPHQRTPQQERPQQERPQSERTPQQNLNRPHENKRPDDRRDHDTRRRPPQDRNPQDRPHQERPEQGNRPQRNDRNERTPRFEPISPALITPEFIPTHEGIERPEQLEALQRRGIPQALRYDDPPYVPDKPAKGSDSIFFKDYNPLYTGARGLAIKILSRLDQSDSYLDKLLEYELAHCDLKPVDRALLTELVHGVTRWQAKLDWVLTGFYHGEFVKCIVPVKNAMRIALYQVMFLQRIPPFAAVSESVELIKRLKGHRSGNLVNAILRNILNNINNIRYPLRHEDVARHFSIIYSHPFWMVKRWIERFGEKDAEELLRMNNERPKITLRMNMMRCVPEELFAFLQAQDVKRWNSPIESERLVLVGSLSSVREWKPFQEGWFSVQDPSAAMVVRLASPQRGQIIYDLCAAPGGKSTFAAELTNDEATIIALDKYAGKLKVIQENTERLRLTSITAQAQDARTFAPKEKADIVLLDAPCSGLGTLAKKPDIKWKFEITDFTPILRTQRELLTNAAKLVKVGGALVYSTCTIEPEENTAQIAWFLKEFPNYELDRAENYLPETLCKDGFMQMFPHVHQTDGAFAARLVRKS
ncbi:MAG: 16S rRNA (cytosine(967)-C(5))-methyltransferase RsmB [Candidatus Kapabacteria bacterium]|nr:16S rRNA (cytosine(967)-C(5))-methyltransferase RsmB [Candidatus Kapabacteria bacterium]